MRSRVALPLFAFTLVFGPSAFSQNDQRMAEVLQRLEKLEEQNRILTEEVQALRQRLGVQESPKPPVEERLDVQERRTEELADTKVQASRRLPISLTGMVLFNAYLNSRHNGAQENPTTASLNPVPRTAGGTVRQTVIGLEFESPTSILGASVEGNVFMDFFANPTPTTNSDRAISGNLNRLMRLRTAAITLDWGSTSVLVGQEKPIISPRDPNTLATVGVSPLTNAGNPWLWQPQVRLQQTFSAGQGNEVRLQAGIFQTAEAGQNVPQSFAATLESSRPGWEGRIEFRRAFANERHLEVATGAHLSTTHVVGTSVPSRLYTLDWSLAPVRQLVFSGLFYRGQNTSNLGTLRPGFTIMAPGQAIPVHSLGGWSQLSYLATNRLTFNVFGGQHDDRDRDLRGNAIRKNFAYAGNALLRIAPNVLLGFELMQVRTDYLNAGRRLNNHYDLALAYQF